MLDDRRFLFVTGKGGVGKSTVSLSLSIALAARGKRVLIALCNAKERVSTMLGSPPLGPDIARVRENVWAVNIEPEHSLEQYGAMILKIRPLYTAVFQSRYVRSFFRAVPGLYDWSMLGKAWYHSTEMLPDGRPRFDVVVFDAPATGHGLDMLRVPKVILDVAPPGILRRDAERAWTMLHDPQRAAVVVVTLPEELPASETIELSRAIKDELGLGIGSLVINRKLDRLFSPREGDALARTILRPVDHADAAIAAATRRATREAGQERSLERLSVIASESRVVLPELFETSAGSTVEELATRF